MKKMRRLLCLTMIVLLLFNISGCKKDPVETENDKETETQTQGESQETTREITDLAERKVTVSTKPSRVATMQGPTYEMVFTLGAKDQIALVREDHPTEYPLAQLTNPDIVNYATLGGVGPDASVNVEEFLNHEVDLVVYWNIEQELEKFDSAGIPAIVINWSTFEPTNIDEYQGDIKKQLFTLADILGGDAPGRYKEWESYYDKTVEFIRSRTSQLKEDEFPSVYWGNTRGVDILSTYPMNPREFEVALCGGKLVSVEKGGQFPKITKEQLLGWEPDVIIVDNHGGKPEEIIETLKTGGDWISLPAVKNDRIYRIPSGVFYLDKGTSRAVFYYWLAKELHPDLFRDVDLVEELKYYFTTFYDYDLSTEEAEKVIAGWVEK